ncbi:MAG: type IV secretion protein Rhs, partial [Bacillota bacterium]|nr:type IV secretion protein Rhs [Bacillota bacterium]
MKKRIIKSITILIIISILANMLMVNMTVSASENTMLDQTETTGAIGNTTVNTVGNTSGNTTGNTSNVSETNGISQDPIKKKEVVLPLMDKQSDKENPLIEKKTTTSTTRVLKHSIQYDHSQNSITTDTPTKMNGISLMSSSPPDAIPVNENEVKVLNGEVSEENNDFYTFVFTPSVTGVYVVTASGSTVPYISLYDSQNSSLGYNRTYPEKSDSVAGKLYAGQQYLVYLSSVSLDTPTEFSVRKYVSGSAALSYTFVDNTYTEEDNASVVVTIPNLAVDLFYGVLDRDIIIEAELLKDGALVEKIPEIPQKSIRGAAGTPEDNILQFICEFGKVVDYGEYTVKITCKDTLGNIVIDTCQSNVKIGNPVSVYMPSNSLSYNSSSGQQRVFFKDVNTDKGSFVVLDNNKIIGRSNTVDIRSTSINYNELFNNYSMTSHAYEYSKFEKILYYSDIPNFTLNQPLEINKNYSIKLVAGVSEYDTIAKLIATDELVLNMVSYESLYSSSKNFIVYTEFFNLKNANPGDITVELVDLTGKVVATQKDYICESYQAGDNSTILRHNLDISTPLDTTKKYSIKISYTGNLYVNTKGTYISAYPSGDYLSLKTPTILDYEDTIINVPTYQCDKTLEYDVILTRQNDLLNIPISELSGVKPNESGTFILNFPQDSEISLLTPGVYYNLEFKYNRPSSDNGPDTATTGFEAPQGDDISNVDKNISFYPPVAPSIGETEFTISGYEIENGIMGTDNENINIELIADNEVYGVVDKETIKKNASVFSANPSYSSSQVTITGTLKVSKTLKKDTQ